MAKRLTDIAIRNLKPPAVRCEIPDGNGLYLQLQPSGKRSFAVRFRFKGVPKKLTLPPGLTLAAARRLAAEAKEQVEKGIDPAAAKHAAKVDAMEAAANTVANICAAYLKREGSKLRTSDQRESIFRRLVYPHIGDRPVSSIKRSDLVQMLDRIEDHNGPRAADVTLATLRRVLTWHALRDDDFANPIIRGMNRQVAKDHRRERILDDDEIRKLWAATEDNTPFSVLVRLALLTSARRREVAGLCWDEIDDGGVWTLPASRSKTKTEITRPLSKAALALIEQMPRIEGCRYIFTSNGIAPTNNFSDPKRKLDLVSGTSGWRLHDLRRTARSLLSRAGVHSDIAEKCLGHSRGDIVERYDRHSYTREMRDAFEALSVLVTRIINPPEGEVADMAAERSKRRRR